MLTLIFQVTSYRTTHRLGSPISPLPSNNLNFSWRNKIWTHETIRKSNKTVKLSAKSCGTHWSEIMIGLLQLDILPVKVFS